MDAYVDQKDFTAAARELERVLSTTAKTDDTAAQRYALNKQLAYVYQMKGETGRSIDLYERLLQVPQAQNDLQLRKNLAIAYHQGGQLDKALALYQDLAHRQAMAQANGGAGADPALNHDIGALLVSMGDTLYDKGNFAKAFEQYQTAVSYDSASVMPFMGMANAALAQQQYGIASDNYQQVLTRDANNTEAMAGLGQIALHQQNFAEAIERFQALTTQQPQKNGSLGEPQQKYSAQRSQPSAFGI